MMTPEPHINAPVRVSIFERIVPSLAFALAALSGAIGALMNFRMLRIFKESENVGFASFFGGVAETELVVGVVLVVAAVLGAIGILVSIIRLFTTNATSSPPGILFLLLGLLSVIPPFAMHYLLHWMKRIVASPDPTDGGISGIAGPIDYISYFAIGSAILIAIVLLAFSFIPFSSRPGRKVLPLVALMLVQILIAVLTGVYFWEARTSIAERDRDREPRPIAEYVNPDANTTTDDFVADDSDTNTSGNAKTISGGVLNGKAKDLPQPPYPPAARAVRASGQVSVHVTVDVKGNVVSATAISGHPLLRSAAVQAARQAKFTPTQLAGKPVKVTGVITYNFSAE